MKEENKIPCYTIQTCSCSLEVNNDTSRKHLSEALKKLGWTVNCDTKTESFTFYKGSITGVLRNNKLSFTGAGSKELDTDEIKRTFSKEIVIARSKEYIARGWNLSIKDNAYVLTKPQGQQIGVSR